MNETSFNVLTFIVQVLNILILIGAAVGIIYLVYRVWRVNRK